MASHMFNRNTETGPNVHEEGKSQSDISSSFQDFSVGWIQWIQLLLLLSTGDIAIRWHTVLDAHPPTVAKVCPNVSDGDYS